MDVDAFAKAKGGKKGGKGKDKGSKSKKFDGNFWCGACGHMMEDCQKKASGKPQASKSPRGHRPVSVQVVPGGWYQHCLPGSHARS